MNSTTSASLFTLLLAGIGMFLLILTIPAPGSEVCLTKKEARELWPKAHIYWYSSKHCWSNRRGPPHGLKLKKIDPIKQSFAKQSEPDADKCCWPNLPRDAEGNIIEPPPTFQERWNQVLDLWRAIFK